MSLLSASDAAYSLFATMKPSGLPVPNPTKSFWIDTPNANPLASYGSTGQLTTNADICIIGSGITGVSMAYHLSRAAIDPLKVVILEARDFCSGATGRNGGHLTPAAFYNFKHDADKYGLDEALRSLALEAHTVGGILDIVQSESLADDIDLVDVSHVDLVFAEHELIDAKADYDAAKAAGVNLDNVEFLTKEQTNTTYGASYPSFRIPGHDLWPLKLVTALYKLAESHNPAKFDLTLHTRTPATAITRSKDIWTVSTPRGSIACPTVIHATNAYASHLIPEMSSSIVPARGQVIALRAAVPLERLTTASWSGNEGFEYWFPRTKELELTVVETTNNQQPLSNSRKNPIVILGGGREVNSSHFGFGKEDDSVMDPAVSIVLKAFLPKTFPGLFEVGREPEMEWSGIMGFTQMHDPFVGPVLPSSKDTYKGQFIAAGFSGHGMPRTFGCAEVLAQIVLADIAGKNYTVPEWFPKRYLTTRRVGVNGSKFQA